MGLQIRQYAWKKASNSGIRAFQSERRRDNVCHEATPQLIGFELRRPESGAGHEIHPWLFLSIADENRNYQFAISRNSSGCNSSLEAGPLDRSRGRLAQHRHRHNCRVIDKCGFVNVRNRSLGGSEGTFHFVASLESFLRINSKPVCREEEDDFIIRLLEALKQSRPWETRSVNNLAIPEIFGPMIQQIAKSKGA